MKNYKMDLVKQLNEIENLIAKGNRNIAKLKDIPDFKVNVSKSHGSTQYYLVDRSTGIKKYAGKKQLRLVNKIIQKDYEMAAVNILEMQKTKLEQIINTYDIEIITKLYEDMPEAKKKMIIPIIEPDEMYIQRWLEEHTGNQNPFPSDGKYYTSQGVYVRSKSEKIIADLLDKYNVPYRYEPLLELNSRYTVYPDFVILNVRKRKTIYWEHLGMLGDVDYARKNFEKIAIYEQNGYNVGDNLLISMESEDKPFDAKSVENKIKKYCI
ncbi:hypothetical protein NXH64_10260 [Butyrivibrio fibrisolvens]|uniref:hypothetical protein n=1 Tax=Pseudobutyrivibrio ruminis TaxID=46206 RepID=UPI0004173114|nr:hypothetical protein [Pseudobutyrivibrio ruminis]MDC7279880.1 hypothetical protein [Butyrivibrio fibrisolvens]